MAACAPTLLRGARHVTIRKNPVSRSAMVPGMSGSFLRTVCGPLVGVAYGLVNSLVNGSLSGCRSLGKPLVAGACGLYTRKRLAGRGTEWAQGFQNPQTFSPIWTSGKTLWEGGT